VTPTSLPPLPVSREHAPIPAVLHQVWVGPPVPGWVTRSWANWRAFLPPTWELRIWDDRAVTGHPVLDRTRRVAADLGIGPRGLSNMLRVQIVALLGGLYTDVDCLPMGSIDGLAGDRPSWVACAPESARKAPIENSCFGFRAGHPFLAEVLADAQRNLARGVLSDFYLGGSRSFGTVFHRDPQRGDLEVRFDYTISGAVDLRRALADLGSADPAGLLAKYGPFPVAHVFKPRL
jgi:hypothetical protein